MKIHYEKLELNHVESIDKLEDFLDHRLISRKALESDILDSNIYGIVAIHDKKAIAYGYAKLMVDHADIIAICVSADFRNINIGTNILSMIEKYLKENNKNIEKIFLEVRDSNIPAINLYEKLGFKIISTRKKYYDNVEDALIYEKSLTN